MHKKNDLVEIVDFGVCDKVGQPYFDIRLLNYRVLKIVEVYHSAVSTEYKAQLVYNSKVQEYPTEPACFYYSDYQSKEGIWYTQEEEYTPIKAFSLNALFLQLAGQMKDGENRHRASEDFMDILTLVTYYREQYVGMEE